MYKNNIVKVIVSERIVILLNNTKVTQAELGKYLNVGQSTISDWKNGKRLPGIDSYMNIWLFFSQRYLYLPLDEWCQFHNNSWFSSEYYKYWTNDFNDFIDDK